MKSLILSIGLIFAAAFPLLAQTNTSSADINAVAVSQAPDDVIKKLSDLIHVGKYTEAQQLATGLLLAYPDDQRLIKAKMLLDKLLAEQTGNTTSLVSEPAAKTAPIVQAVKTTPDKLTGMDKVEYNSLIELGREAQQTTDLDQQKASLNQFMKESAVFLQRHPDELLIWELRAATALSLDDMLAGYEAGQRLLASGKADNDQDMQRLLSQLNIKGWLDKEKAVVMQKQKKNEVKYAWLLGTWNVSTTAKGGAFVKDTTSTWSEKFVATGLIIEGYEIRSPADIELIENIGQNINDQISKAGIGGALAQQVQTATATAVVPSDTRLIMEGKKPDLRGTIHASGEITWEFASHGGWTSVISCETSKDQGTMKMLFDPTGKGSTKKPETLLFTKGDIQNQQIPIQQALLRSMF
jgi:hypothetical protein